MNPTDVDFSKWGQLLNDMKSALTEIQPMVGDLTKASENLPEEEKAKLASEMSKINTDEIMTNISEVSKQLSDLSKKCQ